MSKHINTTSPRFGIWNIWIYTQACCWPGFPINFSLPAYLLPNFLKLFFPWHNQGVSRVRRKHWKPLSNLVLGHWLLEGHVWFHTCREHGSIKDDFVSFWKLFLQQNKKGQFLRCVHVSLQICLTKLLIIVMNPSSKAADNKAMSSTR